MSKNPKEYLALALDNVEELGQIKTLVDATKEYFGIYKIGLEQFVRFGPSVLDTVRSNDGKIFLDLKLHDIPNTVAKAVKSAATHGVDLLTIHTLGGYEMMSAAAEAAKSVANAPKLIGVTILTSMDQDGLAEINITKSVAEQVQNLAQLAAKASLDGIVCSAADLPQVHSSIPQNFEIITPGIRLQENDANDQKRIATPEDAIKNGSTVLVIGRAVTAAEDPRQGAHAIYEAVESSL